MMEYSINNNNQNYFANNELLDLFDGQFSIEEFKKNLNKEYVESNRVLDTVRETIQKNEKDDDVKLIVNLTDEQKQAYKNGTLKLDCHDGEMYAQLKNNGRYGKKLSISEDLERNDITVFDAQFAAELNAIKSQLDKMVNALEDIEGYVVDVLEGLHNDRIGLFYSGLSLYVEACQMKNSSLKELMISQAIKSISDSQAQVMQEFKYDLSYLVNREYKSEKGKQKRIKEKMDNIHRCYDAIYRAMMLKSIIYFDLKQLGPMLMSFEEYSRFMGKMVEPHAEFLIECDSREKTLINTIWQKRVAAFKQCKEIQNTLENTNTYYLLTEGE